MAFLFCRIVLERSLFLARVFFLSVLITFACAQADDHFDLSNVRAAGTLVIDCRDDKPAMLGVMQYQQDHLVFSPPGGWINAGEHPKQGAVRETREETGYTVIAEKILGHPPMMFNLYVLVLASVDKSKRVSSNIHEVVDIKWAHPADIPIEDWRFPNQKQWIIDLFTTHAPKDCE